jgi:hypothetical protein
MDKKYTSLENTIRNVVRGSTGAAQDNRSLESKIRNVVLKEEVELDEARRKSAASLGFIITPSGRKPLINEAELDEDEELLNADDIRRKYSAKARQAPPTAPEPEKKFSYTNGENVTSTYLAAREAEMKDAASRAFMNRAVAAISSAMREEVGLEEGSEKFAKIMARTAAKKGEPITTDTTELEKKHNELLQTSREAAYRAKQARTDYENLARQYGIPVEESAYMPAGTNIKQPSAGSSLGDRAIDTALDIAPIIGTYRDFKRGNYGMAALGGAMDIATILSLGAGAPEEIAARAALRGGAKLAGGAEARALGSEARAATRTSPRGAPEPAKPAKGKTGETPNERKRAEAESKLDAITSAIGGSGGSPMPMPTLKASSQPSAMGSNNPINVHRAGARKVYGQEIHYSEYSPDGNYIGEDADSERSAIENVARPNSKNKLTKNAEIKAKILEDTARRKNVILRAKKENENGKDGANPDIETKPELKHVDVNEQEVTASNVAGTLAKRVIADRVPGAGAAMEIIDKNSELNTKINKGDIAGAVIRGAETVANRVPGVGVAIEIGDKNSPLNTRINKGDIVGAAIRGAETVANQVPGGGTLVGASLGAVNTARDFILDHPSRVSPYGTSGMQKSDAKSWDDNNPQRNAKIGKPSQFPSK